MNLTESQKKALTEYIGEPLYDTTYDEVEYCGVKVYKALRTFTTGNDMVAVKEAIVKRGEWGSFYLFARNPFELEALVPCDDGDEDATYDSDYSAWLFRPTDEAGEPHFCRLVCEWKGWK